MFKRGALLLDFFKLPLQPLGFRGARRQSIAELQEPLMEFGFGGFAFGLQRGHLGFPLPLQFFGAGLQHRHALRRFPGGRFVAIVDVFF
jgi:hypothetical protein